MPCIGIGRCDSVSRNDDDDNPLPAGGPTSLMYSFLSSKPTESIKETLNRIRVPSLCSEDDKGKIIGRKSVTFGSLPEDYTVEKVFGKLNITDEDSEYITDVYDFLFEDYE